MRTEKLILGLITVAVVACVWLSMRAGAECKARGGEMVQTGGHYQTVLVGKVATMQYIPHYSCTK